MRKTLSQKELFKIAKEKMMLLPPEDWHEGIYPSDQDNYFYFSGLWHIKNKLITPEIINDLQSGCKLLSVGVGDGNLERLLHLGFNVPKNNIHLADIFLHEKIISLDFPTYLFDMTKTWPKLPNDFDYVIFPESLGVSLMRFGEQCITTRFHEQMFEIVNSTMSHKKVYQNERDFYLDLMEQDIPKAMPTYNTLKQAYNNLTNGGEIRVSRNGGIPHEQMKTYLTLKFKREFPESSYSFIKEGPSVIRKL